MRYLCPASLRSRRRAAGVASVLLSGLLVAALAAGSLAFLARPARADDALLLPQGVFRVRARPFVAWFDRRWDPDGRAESIAADLDGVQLDSGVFPDLAALERLYGMEAGTLSAGLSSMSSRVRIEALVVALEGGITSWLTVGAILPLLRAQSTVERLTLAPGNLGKNTCELDCPVKRSDSSYVPIDHDADPATRPLEPLTLDQVQELLHDEYGYRRIGDWRGEGLGDLELGLKAALPWTALLTRAWTSSLQAGFRLPTGRVDDPDDLTDVGFGDGQTDVAVYWQNDLAAADWLRLNATLRYTWQLPDFERLRVPPSANLPIASPDDTENVWRDLGDVLEAELGLFGRLYRAFYPFTRVLYVSKGRDDIRGSRGLTYDALEEESARTDLRLEGGLTFSTIPYVESSDFPLPFDLTLAYDRSLGGSGNTPIASTLRLEAAVYFQLF